MHETLILNLDYSDPVQYQSYGKRDFIESKNISKTIT